MSLEDINWDFKDSDTDVLTSRIHSYHAKFIPQIPEKIIDEVGGEKVLDPFVGSGTTTMVSGSKGIESCGFDLNPLACLIARVKCRNYNIDSIKQEYNNMNIDWSTEDTVDFPDKHEWFKHSIHRKLSGLYNSIERVENKKHREFFEVCFSAIVNKVSKTPKRNAYIGDNMFPEDESNNITPDLEDYDVKSIFENRMEKNLNLINRLGEVVEPEIYNKNSKNISEYTEKEFDLLITSPPYPNAVDYARYHRLSFYWLGYPIRDTRDEEIGARSKRGRKKAVEDYFNEVKQVYEECYNVMKKGGEAFIVVGDSQSENRKVKNTERTIRILENIGFNHQKTMTRKLSSQTTPSKSITEENIIHVSK